MGTFRLFGFLLGCSLLLLACGGRPDSPEPTRTVAAIPSTESIAASTATVSATGIPSPTVPIPTAVPLREGLVFPTTTITYPEDAPSAMQLPTSFALVSAASGGLPTGSANGWSAQFRFDGDVEEATSQLEDFFQEQGWSSERLDVGDNEVMLLVEQPEGAGAGSVILGADENGGTLILLTVRA